MVCYSEGMRETELFTFLKVEWAAKQVWSCSCIQAQLQNLSNDCSYCTKRTDLQQQIWFFGVKEKCWEYDVVRNYLLEKNTLLTGVLNSLIRLKPWTLDFNHQHWIAHSISLNIWYNSLHIHSVFLSSSVKSTPFYNPPVSAKQVTKLTSSL